MTDLGGTEKKQGSNAADIRGKECSWVMKEV